MVFCSLGSKPVLLFTLVDIFWDILQNLVCCLKSFRHVWSNYRILLNWKRRCNYEGVITIFKNLIVQYLCFLKFKNFYKVSSSDCEYLHDLLYIFCWRFIGMKILEMDFNVHRLKGTYSSKKNKNFIFPSRKSFFNFHNLKGVLVQSR